MASWTAGQGIGDAPKIRVQIFSSGSDTRPLYRDGNDKIREIWILTKIINETMLDHWGAWTSSSLLCLLTGYEIRDKGRIDNFYGHATLADWKEAKAGSAIHRAWVFIGKTKTFVF